MVQSINWRKARISLVTDIICDIPRHKDRKGEVESAKF